MPPHNGPRATAPPASEAREASARAGRGRRRRGRGGRRGGRRLVGRRLHRERLQGEAQVLGRGHVAHRVPPVREGGVDNHALRLPDHAELRSRVRVRHVAEGRARGDGGLAPDLGERDVDRHPRVVAAIAPRGLRVRCRGPERERPEAEQRDEPSAGRGERRAHAGGGRTAAGRSARACRGRGARSPACPQPFETFTSIPSFLDRHGLAPPGTRAACRRTLHHNVPRPPPKKRASRDRVEG